MGYNNIVFGKDTLFLVTGGAGFIGSNLCEAILNLGYKVRCLDDLSTGSQANVDLFIDHPDYSFIKGDIKDLNTCLEACEGVDYVLNQAAWGSVPRSIEMPLFYCANNITGTLNMMEAARQSKVNSFDDDDYQYDLMPTEDGTKCEVWRSLSPFVQYTLGTAAPKDGQLAPEIPAKFTRTDEGYVYEVSIPKAYVLPVKLTPGWNFALGIYVADRDTAKSIKQARFLGIDPKGGCWNRPLNWPVCILTE